MSLTVANDEDSKELFVDLDSRKKLPVEAGRINDVKFDDIEEFIIKYRLSRETAI